MLKRFVCHEILPKGPSEQAGIARRDLLAVSRSEDQIEGRAGFQRKTQPTVPGPLNQEISKAPLGAKDGSFEADPILPANRPR